MKTSDWKTWAACGLVALCGCASETMKNPGDGQSPAATNSTPSGSPAGTQPAATTGATTPGTATAPANMGTGPANTNTPTTTTTTTNTTTPPSMAPASAAPAANAATMDPKTPFAQLPASCKGFEVVGLKESPGGSTLPNICAPFDSTYNNPYAIQCQQADPNYKTDFPGDQFCILPPPATLGTQIRVGPADYANPGDFALQPGQEVNTTYNINAPNAEAHYYYRTSWRMRPGSHHMIINVSDTDQPDGWQTGIGGFGGLGAGGTRSFGGSQRVNQDRPLSTLDTPPENQGLGAQLSAKQQFMFNLHHINSTNEPVLREVWVNVWYMDEKDVTQKMQGLTGMGSPTDVSIPAHQKTVLQYKCAVSADARIIGMTGHRHAHTERFGIWVKRKSGEMIDAYESFNWEDMPSYGYDSVSTNPTPDVANRIDGASSGTLNVSSGDELWFECDINNDLDQPLKFANETFTGEMCILFGSYVGAASPCSGTAQRVK